MIEFSLSFLLFLAIVLGFSQLALAVWIKTTLHHSVREGVRYAITGATSGPSTGHVASIKETVHTASGGLVTIAQLATNVNVRFFDSAGVEVAGVGSNTGGNTVIVEVVAYPIPTLASQLLTFVPGGLQVSARGVGRLEPYTTPPSL